MKAYLKSNGSTIFGEGVVEANPDKAHLCKYRFVCSRGIVLFDNADDMTRRGIYLLAEPTEAMLENILIP